MGWISPSSPGPFSLREKGGKEETLSQYDLGHGHQAAGELFVEKIEAGLGGFAVGVGAFELPIQDIGDRFGGAGEADGGLALQGPEAVVRVLSDQVQVRQPVLLRAGKKCLRPRCR